jgi:hypothetical protein
MLRTKQRWQVIGRSAGSGLSVKQVKNTLFQWSGGICCPYLQGKGAISTIFQKHFIFAQTLIMK